MVTRTTRLGALLLALALLAALVLAALAQDARTLRVHYVNEQNDYAYLGIWSWGGVATPSEQLGAWPGVRTVFPAENISPEGAWLDIHLADNAAEVGLLVIDGAGNKRTPEDVLIPLPSPELREVWVNDAMDISFEDLRAIPEGHVRVRYLSESGAYDDMGVWFWAMWTPPASRPVAGPPAPPR